MNLCLFYIFRIRDDWSFDDELAEKYKCEVHSFDPRYEQIRFECSIQTCNYLLVFVNIYMIISDFILRRFIFILKLSLTA